MSGRHRKVVRVSHIGSSENLDSDTQIGTIIINFLVGSKVDPNANVAMIIDTPSGRVLKSLYDFDLYDLISTLPGSPDLILTSVNFDSDIIKRESLLSLIEYLEGVINKSYDDNNIYEKARIELERVPVTREKITRTVLTGPKSGYVPAMEEEEDVITYSTTSPIPQRHVRFDNDISKLTPSDTRGGREIVYSRTPNGTSFGSRRQGGY